VSDYDGVAIVSGGLDSVTMVYELLNQGCRPRLLSFDYGQRHKKELEYATMCSERLQLDHHIVDLSSINALIGKSALTGGAEVPEGHYAKDNMAITVVPNRNMMMISVAAAAAVNDKLEYVAAGMHTGDYAQYPDCRENFLSRMEAAILAGNEGFIDPGFCIHAPWVRSTKNDIARRAYELQVPIQLTWSCYKGGTFHCGRCGTCVERLEAIDSVGDPDWDTTVYVDDTYWRTVTELSERQT
jgi:7-cyano-7-deazaguanine synthase